MKLNLGCGAEKLTGYINADIDITLKPDIVMDLKQPFPWQSEVADSVVMFHTIEHIERKYHFHILTEIHRILKPAGKLAIAYPEFSKCVTYWLLNKQGKRDFWEATIYGRQLSPSDYHVCAMHTPEFKEVLREVGFIDIEVREEKSGQDFYTVLLTKKGSPLPTYEDVVNQIVFGGNSNERCNKASGCLSHPCNGCSRQSN